MRTRLNCQTAAGGRRNRPEGLRRINLRGTRFGRIAAIVLHAGVANVDTVIVGGNIVKQNGKLTYGDYGDLSRRSAELKRSSERLYAGFNSDATAA